jgi:hypothetical protein
MGPPGWGNLIGRECLRQTRGLQELLRFIILHNKLLKHGVAEV